MVNNLWLYKYSGSCVTLDWQFRKVALWLKNQNCCQLGKISQQQTFWIKAFLKHQEKPEESDVQNCPVFIPDSQSRISTEGTSSVSLRSNQMTGKHKIKYAFPKGATSKSHLSPSASWLNQYKQPLHLPSIHLLIQNGFVLMFRFQELSCFSLIKHCMLKHKTDLFSCSRHPTLLGL